MSVVKAEELRSKTPDELKSQLTTLKKEAFNFAFRGLLVKSKTQPVCVWCVGKSLVFKPFSRKNPAPPTSRSPNYAKTHSERCGGQ